jgi:HPt (histidine-containing phosphotransfer) domain-containing protein
MAEVNDMKFGTTPPEDLLEYVNYEEALKRFSGSTATLKRLLVSYLAKNPYTQLRESLEAGDLEAAATHAHSLKGVVGNMSLSALFDVSARVCDELKQGEISEELKAQLDRVTAKTSGYVNWLSENM